MSGLENGKNVKVGTSHANINLKLHFHSLIPYIVDVKP